MSNVKVTDWKLKCRKKLEDELYGCEKALNENYFDPVQRSIDIHRARRASAAIERFDQGSWGFCRECNDPIEQKRLIALPYAEFCIDCQIEMEKQNRFRVSTAVLVSRSA